MSRNNNYSSWGQPQASYQNGGQYQSNEGFMPQLQWGGQPRGGYRGGRPGRRNNHARNGPPRKEVVPDPGLRPSVEAKGELPKPQHLSKTSSELKNDPLYEEAFFPSPSEELREISKESSIYPACDGLMPLVSELYSEICARSTNYRRNVPLSAHNYYFGMLTYARLLYLEYANKGHLTHGEVLFVDQVVEHGEYTVPASFSKYLGGFGNTALPSGVKQWFRLRKPRLVADDAIPGYFGRISRYPGSYASYPCPGVFAQRIMEDIRFTEEGQDPDWDLPHDFLYHNNPINVNCIGYADAVRLSPEQIQFLRTKSVNQHTFGQHGNELPFNSQLMNGVQKYMSEVPGMKMLPFPKNDTGSQGQLVTVEVTVFDHDRDRSLFTAKAPLKIVGSIAYLGASFLYKFRKTRYNRNDQVSLLPNDFGNVANIPDAYIDNFIQNCIGLDPKLDEYDYESTGFLIPLRVKNITRSDIIAKM